MAKVNGKAKSGTDTFDALNGATADSVKKSFEQFMTFGGDFSELNRAGMQAFAESAKAAGKGFEAMNTQAFNFFKSSMERSVEATRAMTGTNSFEEVTEMQAKFAKDAFQAYIEQMNQMANLFASTMRDTVEPLNAQAGTVVEKFQGAA